MIKKLSKRHLDNSSNFKKSFQVVDLAKRHSHEDEGLEEGPHDDPRVCVLIDGSMDTVANSHVFLLVLHAWKLKHKELSCRKTVGISFLSKISWLQLVGSPRPCKNDIYHLHWLYDNSRLTIR